MLTQNLIKIILVLMSQQLNDVYYRCLFTKIVHTIVITAAGTVLNITLQNYCFPIFTHGMPSFQGMLCNISLQMYLKYEVVCHITHIERMLLNEH